MHASYIYRTGSHKDLSELKALGIVAYGQFSKVFSPEHWNTMHALLASDKTWADLLKTSTPFVCETNGKVIGMAFLVPNGNPTDIYNTAWCYIRMVGVHPEHTGKGIAKKLAQSCIDHARQTNEKIIALHTSEYMDAARHIYESLGFRILKEIPPRFGKRYWLYQLELNKFSQ